MNERIRVVCKGLLFGRRRIDHSRAIGRDAIRRRKHRPIGERLDLAAVRVRFLIELRVFFDVGSDAGKPCPVVAGNDRIESLQGFVSGRECNLGLIGSRLLMAPQRFVDIQTSHHELLECLSAEICRCLIAGLVACRDMQIFESKA